MCMRSDSNGLTRFRSSLLSEMLCNVGWHEG